MDDVSTYETFWTVLCRYSRYYYLMLMAVTVFTVLNLLTLLITEPGTEEFYITLISLAFFGLTAAGIATLLWTCNRL